MFTNNVLKNVRHVNIMASSLSVTAQISRLFWKKSMPWLMMALVLMSLGHQHLRTKIDAFVLPHIDGLVQERRHSIALNHRYMLIYPLPFKFDTKLHVSIPLSLHVHISHACMNYRALWYQLMAAYNTHVHNIKCIKWYNVCIANEN